MRQFVLLSLLAVLPLRGADNPAVKKLLDHWNKSKEYMVEIANQMPAESYVSRPNDQEMTFGEQMVHIANGILYMTKNYAPEKCDFFDQKKAAKGSAVAAIQTAFDNGAKTIGSFSDQDLMTNIVDTNDGKMTELEAVILIMDHVEHHRGQAVVYLRYKGIKPVDYRF